MSFSEEKSEEFLHVAYKGNLEKVKSLSVDREVSLNWQDGNGCTSFYYACACGHVDIVRYLLDFHDNHPREPIDYNWASDFGWTSFFSACYWGRDKVVEMLLEDDRIDVNRTIRNEQTPLWGASSAGHLGVVKRLLASTREIDVLKKDNREKKTAAEIAREQGAEAEKGEWQNKVEFRLITTLIDSYLKDPEGVRKHLRRELGLDAHLAGELFALGVYLSDGYLSIRPERQSRKKQRFLSIAARLPMELQMVLCNRAFGLPDSIVKNIDSERGFRKFAKGF